MSTSQQPRVDDTARAVPSAPVQTQRRMTGPEPTDKPTPVPTQSTFNHHTLKNKGASRCHRRTLSKWFHKDFNIWRTFLFHKMLFVVKEGSSDYKKVRKRWFFKKPLSEWFFVEPKMVPLASLEEPFVGPLFFVFLQVIKILTQIKAFKKS